MPVYQVDINFNSIKVQLKQTFSYSFVALKQFQFHKGTIKTRTLLLASIMLIYFTSIKVKLKPERDDLHQRS